MSEALALALMVAAVAGCIVGSSYMEAKKTEARAAMTPQQMCVQHAWTQADRIECLKTRPDGR